MTVLFKMFCLHCAQISWLPLVAFQMCFHQGSQSSGETFISSGSNLIPFLIQNSKNKRNTTKQKYDQTYGD